MTYVCGDAVVSDLTKLIMERNRLREENADLWAFVRAQDAEQSATEDERRVRTHYASTRPNDGYILGSTGRTPVTARA